MVKNNNVLLIALVLIGGLVAGLIGGAISSGITGDVTLSNNAAGTGTYRIRPEGTKADTWLPWRDGSVYLTSNGLKSGGDIIFRKWRGGTSFTNLAVIDSGGSITAENLYAKNVYTKEEIDAKLKGLGGELTNQQVLNTLSNCNIIEPPSGTDNCKNFCSQYGGVALNTWMALGYYYMGDDSNKKRDAIIINWLRDDEPLNNIQNNYPVTSLFGSDAILYDGDVACYCCPINGESLITSVENASTNKLLK